MEPPYNEPLYKCTTKSLGIANDFLYPSNGKIYGKVLPPVPWPFVISRFHSAGECGRDQYYRDTFVLLGGHVFCVQGPKRTLWQRPHLVPVHGDGVWYSLGTSVNTCGWFLLSTHARIIGQCPSTRSRPCFRALTRYAPNPSVYTSFFLFYFFIFGVINRFALPARFVYELKFRNGVCQGEIKYL